MLNVQFDMLRVLSAVCCMYLKGASERFNDLAFLDETLVFF